MHGHRAAQLGSHLLVELLHRGVELEDGAHGPLGVVFVDDRIAEHGHDGVAQQLVDASAVACDDLGRPPEDPIHDRTHVFGIEPLAECREAGQVAEEHGDLTPLGFGGSGTELRAALVAEPCFVGVFRVAV